MINVWREAPGQTRMYQGRARRDLDDLERPIGFVCVKLSLPSAVGDCGIIRVPYWQEEQWEGVKRMWVQECHKTTGLRARDMRLFGLKNGTLTWLLPETLVMAELQGLQNDEETGLPLVFIVFHDYAFSPTPPTVSPPHTNFVFLEGKGTTTTKIKIRNVNTHIHVYVYRGDRGPADECVFGRRGRLGRHVSGRCKLL